MSPVETPSHWFWYQDDSPEKKNLMKLMKLQESWYKLGAANEGSQQTGENQQTGDE